MYFCDMIELRGITKSFDGLQVLRGIDLDIGQGEIVSVVGPSGAGKTTMLQIAGSLDRPDSGSVKFDGTDIFRLSGGGGFFIHPYSTPSRFH